MLVPRRKRRRRRRRRENGADREGLYNNNNEDGVWVVPFIKTQGRSMRIEDGRRGK